LDLEDYLANHIYMWKKVGGNLSYAYLEVYNILIAGNRGEIILVKKQIKNKF